MALVERLTQIESAGLVRQAQSTPDLEYVFTHALVQEAAYASLLKQDRKQLHARVGEELERAYGTHPEEHAALLAHHFWHAGVWASAASYSLIAGDAALKAYANREAMGHFDRARQALREMPGAPGEQVVDSLLGWARAAFRIRPYAEQLEPLEEAERITRALNDLRRLAKVLHSIGTVHLASGHISRAVGPLTECFALADQLEDERLLIIPTFAMGMLVIDADPRRAVELLDRAARLARKHGDPETQAYALGAGAIVLARLGEPERATRDLDAAFQLALLSGSPAAKADVDLYAGWAFLEMGDVDRSLEYGRRGVDEALTIDYAECACLGYACVGFGHLQVSQCSEARAAFEEAIRRSMISGARMVENEGRAGLAMTQLRADHPDAVREAEQALAEAEQIGNPFVTAKLRLALASAYAGQGDRPRALEVLSQVIDYYSRNGLRPSLAHAVQAREAILAQAEPGQAQTGA